VTVTIHPEPDFEELRYICERMREVDRREIFATRWTDSPVDLACDAARTTGYAWTARLDGRPVSFWGGYPVWPGVWSIFAWGTDDWNRVIVRMTKQIRRVMIPGIVRANAVRVSCASHAHHVEAHRWLESLGGRREGEHPNFGKNGERFFTFVFDPATIEDELAVPRRKRACAVAAR
jgi:hypothetical protein